MTSTPLSLYAAALRHGRGVSPGGRLLALDTLLSFDPLASELLALPGNTDIARDRRLDPLRISWREGSLGSCCYPEHLAALRRLSAHPTPHTAAHETRELLEQLTGGNWQDFTPAAGEPGLLLVSAPGNTFGHDPRPVRLVLVCEATEGPLSAAYLTERQAQANALCENEGAEASVLVVWQFSDERHLLPAVLPAFEAILVLDRYGLPDRELSRGGQLDWLTGMAREHNRAHLLRFAEAIDCPPEVLLAEAE